MLIDTNPDPFRIFGDSDERFHIRGGNDQVPTKLAEALGDRVETDTRLDADRPARRRRATRCRCGATRRRAT